MEKIKLVFIGTAEIGIPLFNELSNDSRFEIELVVTSIDRPAGRGMEPKPSPIKIAAEKSGIPVFQPIDINQSENIEKIRKAQPDIILLFAYGQILSKKVLEIPKHGCINVHTSLLPCHRGASPIQSSLLAGDMKTGISVMQMAEKMDAGPVYAQFDLPIVRDDNASTLHDKLAYLAAKKTPDVLVEIVNSSIKPKPQNEANATYCKKLSKTDGKIDWNEPAEVIVRRIRAYFGWPGAWTLWDGKVLKILSGRLNPGQQNPGHVTKYEDKILIGTGNGLLELITVQIEGKKPVPASEFIKGYPNFIGSAL